MPNPGSRELMEELSKKSALSSIGASASVAAASGGDGPNTASMNNSDQSSTSLRTFLGRQCSRQNSDDDTEGLPDNADFDTGENDLLEENEEVTFTQNEHRVYQQALVEGRQPEPLKSMFPQSSNDQNEDKNNVNYEPAVDENELEIVPQNNADNGQNVPSHPSENGDDAPSGHDHQDQENVQNAVIVDISSMPSGFLEIEAFNQQKRQKFLQQQGIELETAKLELECKKVDLVTKKRNLEIKEKDLAAKVARVELIKEAKEMASAIKNFFTRKSLELPGKSFSL